ncbi:MAG: hypothetical protein OHK0019_04820 [Saprospiraceae bacterium]
MTDADIYDTIRSLIWGFAIGLLMQYTQARYKWSIQKSSLVLLAIVMPASLLLISLDHRLDFGENHLLSIGAGLTAIVVMLWLLRRIHLEKKS